jgi:transcriptional/translational regulatory protein YebC/TACO1
MSADNIENAIQQRRVNSECDGPEVDLVAEETPGNKDRTVSEVRKTYSKNGGISLKQRH